MKKKIPLIVAGIIFSLVALIHLLRLIFGWEIIIDGNIVPMSVSTVGFIISLILAIWMFTASKK